MVLLGLNTFYFFVGGAPPSSHLCDFCYFQQKIFFGWISPSPFKKFTLHLRFIPHDFLKSPTPHFFQNFQNPLTLPENRGGWKGWCLLYLISSFPTWFFTPIVCISLLIVSHFLAVTFICSSRFPSSFIVFPKFLSFLYCSWFCWVLNFGVLGMMFSS